MLTIINFLITVAEIAFVAYWLVPLFYAPFKTSGIYGYLDKVFAPVLAFFRGLIGKHLPAKYLIMDWSYVAVMLVFVILKWIF